MIETLSRRSTTIGDKHGAAVLALHQQRETMLMRLTKRGRSLLITLLITLLASLGPWLSATGAEPLLLDKIVAVVNNEAVLLSELEAEMVNVRRALQANQMAIPALPVLEKQVLERLILKRLQLDWAQNTGIRIDDAQLNQALTDIARSNNLSLSGMVQAIESEGVSYSDFRERVRNDIILTQLRRRFADSAVTVSPEEIKNYLANLTPSAQASEVQYRVAHILIAVSDTATDEAIEAASETADRVLELARSGADFAALAMEYSAATTALQGGDLDWRAQNQLPTLFAQAVPNMVVGEVAGPWRQLGGFHIVKLLERRETGRHIVEQTRAAHILLIPDKVVSEDEVRARLAEYRAAILNGTALADLARAHSQDQASAQVGGDLGWASPGVMVPEFEAEIARLAEGDLSPVFKSRFGWHLVQLTGRRQHDDTDEWQRSRAQEEIHRRKAEEEYDLWLRRMRDEAFIETRI